MAKYIVNRLLGMIAILLGTAFAIFTILYFTPGDPAAVFAGGSATAADIENMRHILGLDKSYLQQLGEFLLSNLISEHHGLTTNQL